jgi:hypothetical protein
MEQRPALAVRLLHAGEHLVRVLQQHESVVTVLPLGVAKLRRYEKLLTPKNVGNESQEQRLTAPRQAR